MKELWHCRYCGYPTVIRDPDTAVYRCTTCFLESVHDFRAYGLPRSQGDWIHDDLDTVVERFRDPQGRIRRVRTHVPAAPDPPERGVNIEHATWVRERSAAEIRNNRRRGRDRLRRAGYEVRGQVISGRDVVDVWVAPDYAGELP